MAQGAAALSLLFLFVVPLLAANAVSGWLMQRALVRVIQIFRDHNAIGMGNAKTAVDLGLITAGEEKVLLGPQEFRAFQMLVEGGIIRATENQMLYIPEDHFARFENFLNRAGGSDNQQIGP